MAVHAGRSATVPMLSQRMHKANAKTRSTVPNVRGCRHVTPGGNQRSVTAHVASVQPKATPATTQKAIDAMYPDDSDEQVIALPTSVDTH